MAIRVVLADDHGVLRDGVRKLLEASDDISVVATVEDGAAAVSKAVSLRPDVVVMDISMPGLNGIGATRALAQKAPAMGVVILSMHSSTELVKQALLAGARGYLLKECAGAEVERAVRIVASGARFLGDGVAAKIIADFPNTRTADDIDRLTLGNAMSCS